MKNIFFCILTVCLVLSCKTPKNVLTENNNSDNPYLVEKIDSVNNFYLVYISYEKKYYKVVSEKSACSYNTIKAGERYPSFIFQSLISEADYKSIMNSPHIDLVPRCLKLNDSTEVCKEAVDDPSGDVMKTKVYDLCKTLNLSGLCYSDLIPKLK